MALHAEEKGLLSGNGIKWALVALIDIALLYVVFLMYARRDVIPSHAFSIRCLRELDFYE